MNRRRLIGGLAATLAGTASAAVFEPREFTVPGAEARYRRLIEELRCLVCQNQNLAASDADLAADLRTEVYRLVESGRSEEQVVAFLVDRYGDFVRYRPPLTAGTLALWVGPFVLGVAGLAALLMAVRRRAASRLRDESLSDQELARAEALLERTDPDPLRSSDTRPRPRSPGR